MAAALALLSALFYGVSDFSGGLAARRIPATTVVLLSNALSLVLALLAVALLPGSTYSTTDLAWGVASGTVGLVGVVLLYRGLAIGPMSVVAPLTAVLSAVVPIVVGVARGERPGTVAVIGILLAVPAVVLIGREPRRHGTTRLTRGALASALCAGIGFGGFYVLLAQTSSNGGAWPLVGQRAASVLILLPLGAVAVARHRGLRQPRPSAPVLRLTLLTGVTDFAANLSYVLATHRGLLALVAVISSLYPAATLLLARGLLAERIGRVQAAGLLLAVLAVALIALR